jgi:signal transduction histidine kinase/ligand-binding sensor domain-containing protein
VRLLAIIYAVVLVPRAHALDPQRLLEQYLHDRWTDGEGYPGGPVNAIGQTPDGYLWFGAENGLVRFDGLTFRIFNHANTDAFPASAVSGLATDADGGLWVLLQNRELLRYSRGVFEPIVLDTQDAPSPVGWSGVTALASGPHLDLLLGRPDNLVRYIDKKFVTIAAAPGYNSRLVISIAETPDGTMWLGTRDHGVFGFHDNQTFQPRGLPDRKVNCLLPVDVNGLWLGTDRGLARWNGTDITQSAVPAPLRTAQILAIARDHDSNLWLGTAHGLMRITPQGSFEAEKQNSGETEPVGAIAEDREGNVWVGGKRGIERYRDRLFLTHTSSGSEDSGPIFTDAAGRTWFGPSTGGLYWLRGSERQQVSEAGLGRDVVYSIAGGPGELWIGRQRGGLTHLRFHGPSWTTETYTRANGLADGPIYTVQRSRDGTVWVGTLNAGVSRLNGGRVATYTTANGLASNSVWAIEEGSEGTMWFATANGLSAFDHDRWRVYTSAEGMPPARTNCLFLDSSGVLWIGTDVGLAFLVNGRVRAPREAGAPLLEEVLGIVDDRLGCLWITTSKHVLRVPRAQILDPVGGTALLREFGPADGIPVPEGVRRARSVEKDSDGRIWLSLRRGISVVEPERLKSSSEPAIVHIESVSADGSPIVAAAPLRVSASRVRIRFDYLALSLSAPQRVKYRYRLDGFDHAWSDPTSERNTTYMNLPPRFYRFRLIASNSEGIWNSSETSIDMEVVPAFWQTWAFRVSIVVVCAAASLVIYRMRLRRFAKELSLGFEERLDERTRIAQELHDTLLQGLVATSMQLHSAVTRLPPDSTMRPQFARVVTMLQQVVNDSRNAVRGLRTSPSWSDDLERAFANVREELAVSESTGFRIIVVGRRRQLNPLIRDEVYRIGREALSNAFRHSGANEVEVEISYDPNDLCVAVRDTGCGIDEEILRWGRDGHWGFIGMRESAEKIGAQFNVKSRVGAGTELDLRIPGHIAFAEPPSGGIPRWLPRWLRRRIDIKEAAAQRGRFASR